MVALIYFFQNMQDVQSWFNCNRHIRTKWAQKLHNVFLTDQIAAEICSTYQNMMQQNVEMQLVK